MDKTKITAGIFIALTVLLSGAYYFESQENIYYCESRDLVGYCDKLSLGMGTRCYFNETYKTCPEGWQKIEGYIEPKESLVDQVEVFANGENYLCEVTKGKINSYSRCLSSTNKEAYLGELI